MSEDIIFLQKLSFELLSKEDIDYLIINKRVLLSNRIQELNNILFEINNDIKEFEVLKYGCEITENSIFIFINDDLYIKLYYYIDNYDFMSYTYLKLEIINKLLNQQKIYAYMNMMKKLIHQKLNLYL